jgi:polar amino acid transport system substrate-binding protein
LKLAWQLREIGVHHPKWFSQILSPLIIAVLFFISFALGNTTEADTLKFTRRTDSEAGKLGGIILQAAYRRIGHTVNLIDLPGARAIAEANRGNSDGEVVRLKRVLNKFQNLRVVPEPLLLVETSIASKNLSIKVSGWETAKKHSATTVRGYKSVERRLKSQAGNFANSVESALKMLVYDRVEIVVLSKLDLQTSMRKGNYPNVHILEPPISKVQLYHMLHVSQEALIPAVAAVLKAMKADGSYQRIIDDYLGS